MKYSFAAVAIVLATATPVYAAMSDADCDAAWLAADQNKDGVLDATEGGRYLASMRVANKSLPADAKFDQALFLENCRAGLFVATTPEEGAPFAGANSFTEGQAQDWILAAGFTNVSALKQDENGVWRGTAELDGKSTPIAVDFKGNVVSK